MKTMVISRPGRDDTTIAMIAALERQNPGEPFWVYRSDESPSIGPFYEMLKAAANGIGSGGYDDVLFLEDDIITARNFIRYARELTTRFVTSFFHVPHQKRVLDVPSPAYGFSFAQAVKLPARVVAMMLAAKLYKHGGGHDDEIGYALTGLGEPVVYHRSLVQHVGERSLAWGPDTTLVNRVAADFPGAEFDCLTLLNDRNVESPTCQHPLHMRAGWVCVACGAELRTGAVSGVPVVDQVVTDGGATLELGTVRYQPTYDPPTVEHVVSARHGLADPGWRAHLARAATGLCTVDGCDEHVVAGFLVCARHA